MTPINPAAAGGLPTAIDPAHAQSIDPSQPGFVDPPGYSTGAASDAYAADPYVAGYEMPVPEANYVSAVAGMQPATTAASGSMATLDDFVALGIFTEDELIQLSQMNMSPQDLGALYDEAVAFMQTPEFAQLQAQQQGMQQVAVPSDTRAVTPTVQTDGVAPTAPASPTGEPAWNGEWAVKFRDVMKEQGLDSKTQLMVIASLRQAPLSQVELEQALEYYAKSPEGKAELQAANEQVRAGARMQDKMLLSFGITALGAGALTTAVASSRGNLVRALTRTASGTGERAAVAARALDDITAGRPLTTAMRAGIASSLRGEAGATSRLRHAFAKASLNGGARNVAVPTSLSFKEAMRYGLWMKSGDAATDAVTGAASAARSTATAAKAGSLGAKVAGGSTQAAMGVSRLGKVGRVLGPVGLALSAGVGIWGIKQTMKAEGGFGEESARMTGNVAGGIAGGVAGAAAGAAIGSVVPVIGTGIGAVVGGIVGGIGVGKIGEGVGGFVHGLFD